VKYFNLSDFDCQETSENEMCPEFLSKLDNLRDVCGFPFIVTSGYRSPSHSIESKKAKPGTHAQGIASDIKVNNGMERYLIVKNAVEMGFNGIGIAKTFIHVDNRTSSPVMWSY